MALVKTATLNFPPSGSPDVTGYKLYMAEAPAPVDYDSPSFFDSALWVANSKVSADTVYKLLSLIYTDEGLKHMYSQKKTFKKMSLKTGAIGIATPFHPGAEKFWKEKGMLK